VQDSSHSHTHTHTHKIQENQEGIKMKYLGVGLFVSSIAGHLLRARITSPSSSRAAGSQLLQSRIVRQCSSGSSSSSRAQAPRAAKVDEIVYFGVNPKNKDEYRGPNPMNPPLVCSGMVCAWFFDDWLEHCRFA
jgi:hypothetical protein